MWDFQKLGIDIVDFFDGSRSYEAFWEFFYMLPSESKTKSAISNDPEYAREFVRSLTEEQVQELSKAREEEEYEPPSEGYDRINSQLDDIRDSVDNLRIAVTTILGGKKSDKEKPVKRPLTELQKSIKRRLWEHDKEESAGILSEFGF